MKLTVEEEDEEVIEKGEDVLLVKIFVLEAVGELEGAMVNFERCDMPSWPPPLDEELFIL